MRRLLKSNLTDDDLEYINDYIETQENIERYNEGMRKEGRREGVEQEKKRSENLIEQAEAKWHQAEAEKKQIETQRQLAEAQKQQAELKAAITRLYFKDGKTIDEIAEITKQTSEDIRKTLE